MKIDCCWCWHTSHSIQYESYTHHMAYAHMVQLFCDGSFLCSRRRRRRKVVCVPITTRTTTNKRNDKLLLCRSHILKRSNSLLQLRKKKCRPVSNHAAFGPLWVCSAMWAKETTVAPYSRPAATVSRDECLHLNDILGVKTLSGCYNIKHRMTNRDDPFATDQGIPKEETRHRSSWLMPRMARRMTRNHPNHVSKWRQDVTIDDADCARLRAMLTEKMGSPIDAEEHLPAACK